MPMPTLVLSAGNQQREAGTGQSAERGMIIDFSGPKPNCIDIKGHLGLGFWYEPNLATMLMKTNGLFYAKPSCDWKT